MKIKSNVDLGKAFDMLKNSLERSKKMAREASHGELIVAFAELSGVTEAVLTYIEEPEPVNDIPSALFAGPGTSD